MTHVAVDIDQPDTFDAKNIVLMNMMRDLGLLKSPQPHTDFEDLQLNLLFLLLCSVELRNFT
jgi:hypothetical protein